MCVCVGGHLNTGCNHFTCTCKHEFCWLCRRDWKTHGAATGGYFQCNIYSGGDGSGGGGSGAADVRAAKAEEVERLSKAAEVGPC